MYYGPVIFQVGYFNGGTDAQVVIKNRDGDYWADSTRTRTCSLTFTDYGTSRGFYVRVYSGDLNNAYMPQHYGVVNFAGITAPTAPTWASVSPNPVEVNTRYTITWGSGGAGTLGIAGYDVEVRAWSGSAWTGWLRIASAQSSKSYYEIAPKDMNVYGVVGAPNVKFQYAIRTSDGIVSTSGWTYSPEVNIAFIAPSSPTSITFSPSTSVKKDETVTVKWTQGNGGSGDIVSYRFATRYYDDSTSTWSTWINTTYINSLSKNIVPVTLYPSINNRDLVQIAVLTKNSWGFESSWLFSGYLTIKGNQLYVYINGSVYEGEVFVYSNGTPYEGEPFVYSNGLPYQST